MKNLVLKIESQLKGIDKSDLTKAEKNILRLIEENKNTKDLEALLEEWSVMDPGAWENEDGPKDWWAVANDEGIKAYFGEESDAFKYRLSKINDALNG